MRIELIRHWQGYKPGRVLAAPDGMANLLIRRGIAADRSTSHDQPKPRNRKATRK